MKRKTLLFVLSILLLFILSLSGCVLSQSEGLEIFILDGDNLSIYPTAQVRLGVKGVENPSFAIETPSLATLSGNVLTISPDAKVGDSITITATSGKKKGKITFAVYPPPPHEVVLGEIGVLKAGESQTLSATISPEESKGHEITYSIASGGDYAYIVGNVLYLKENACKDCDITVIATAGKVSSAPQKVFCSTVFAKAITLNQPEVSLQRGFSISFIPQITPQDCTEEVSLVYLEGAEHISADGLGFRVNDDAPIGARISLYAKVGEMKSNVVSLTVEKTPVESVAVQVSKEEISLIDTLTLSVDIKPSNATYQNYTLSFLEGENIASFKDGAIVLEKGAKEGDLIKFQLLCDGVKSRVVTLTVIATPVSRVQLSTEDSLSLSKGERANLSVAVYPLEANQSFTLVAEDGAEFVDESLLSEGVLAFLDDAPYGEKISVRAYSGGVASEVLTFTLTEVPTVSVVISTEDKIQDLNAGDRVVFQSEIFPENASNSSLTYKIIEGENLGVITDNVFTVSKGAKSGQVKILAQSEDGILSNIITLDVVGSYVKYAPTLWSEIDDDAQVFAGFTSLWLDLSAMSQNTDYATVIVSDAVENMIIQGGYNGEESTLFYNLSFFFQTTDEITVTFMDLGIKTLAPFGGTVIDFGTKAQVELYLEGESFIQAGSPNSPYTGRLFVNGSWEEESDVNYIRKHGQDGAGGENGGIAISAYDLRITGGGNISLIGGNGASGTSGKAGATAPSGSVAYESGKGGDGGFGGDSGFAIYAFNLAIDIVGEMYAFGGNAGTGGEGGKGGLSSPSTTSGTVSSIKGKDGASGKDGVANKALYAVNVYSEKGNITSRQGVVAISTQVFDLDENNYQDQILVLENYYKINIHTGNDVKNINNYYITPQNTVGEILLLLHGLYTALGKFPKNAYIQAELNKEKDINIYLVDKISHGASTVYGLTSISNVMWFATFTTRLRETFYSNYYNIMVHEIFHVFTFGLSASTDTNPLKLNLGEYNGGYSYTTNNKGVYNVLTSNVVYNANNSAFLTTYSKSNFNEDVSDNMSLIVMLANKRDFLEKGTMIYNKVRYISTVYQDKYSTLATWQRLSWLKFI